MEYLFATCFGERPKSQTNFEKATLLVQQEQATDERAHRYTYYRKELDKRYRHLDAPIPPGVLQACAWELGEIKKERDQNRATRASLAE